MRYYQKTLAGGRLVRPGVSTPFGFRLMLLPARTKPYFDNDYSQRERYRRQPAGYATPSDHAYDFAVLFGLAATVDGCAVFADRFFGFCRRP